MAMNFCHLLQKAISKANLISGSSREPGAEPEGEDQGSLKQLGGSPLALYFSSGPLAFLLALGSLALPQATLA